MIVRLRAALCGAGMILVCVSAAHAQTGIASIYAYSGEKTANGERLRVQMMRIDETLKNWSVGDEFSVQ